MPNFKINGTKLNRIKEKSFNLEKDLQLLIEENLGEVFGLQFVSGKKNKQFIVRNFIIDTLAYDAETKSFVIVEYKKDESFSIIDQGFNYLGLLLNNKEKFLVEYEERAKKNIKIADIKWTQSRVMFIAPSFTAHQRGAIAFKDLPFELWEAELFENDAVSLNQVKPTEAEESITKVTKSKAIRKISGEIKVFSVEDHYKKASPQTKILLDELRDRIMQIDHQINEKPVGNYIGYKANWYNFVSIHVFKDKLRVEVRKQSLENDTRGIFKKYPIAQYKWGKTQLWWVDVKSDKTIDYIMPIIKESYDAAPDK